MGIFLMGAEIGTALTPLIVIPIQQYYGWRASFFVLGLIGVVWVAVWRLRYYDHPSDSPRISQTELGEIGQTSWVGQPRQTELHEGSTFPNKVNWPAGTGLFYFSDSTVGVNALPTTSGAQDVFFGG